MLKYKKLKYLILIFFIIFIGVIFYMGSTIGTPKFASIKKLIPDNLKRVLNNTIFVIPNLKKEIELNKNYIISVNNRIKKYENLQSINGYQIENLLVSDENKTNFYELKKYVFNANFILGESELLNKGIPRRPGGYLGKDKNDIFVVSGKGTINYFKKNNLLTKKINLFEIKSNLNSFFVKDEDFFKNAQIGIRDMLVKDDFIYLSFNNLKRESCYNIEIVRAKINYDFLQFKNFYEYDECIEVSKIQKFFINQSGGRIVDFKKKRNSFLYWCNESLL